MAFLKFCIVSLSLIASVGVCGRFDHASQSLLFANHNSVPSTLTGLTDALLNANLSNTAATERYVLDSSQSKFIAHALAGGLLWFKGHDHLIAVREFTGEAQMISNSVTPASLEIIAKSASMVETSDVFTEPQKKS